MDYKSLGIDENKCLCRIWRDLKGENKGKSYDNIQCSRVKKFGNFCNIHYDETKRYFGLITESRPEEPYKDGSRYYWIDQYKPENKRGRKKKVLKTKAISLFSGMGGDSVGIVKAGLELVAYSEWEKDMRDTHELNFPNTELLGCGDITKTSDDEFLKYKDIVDLIFAGFPCQGFSNAGNKDPNDPRNSLFREFARSAKLIKPKYVIGENVKGLLQRKTANGEEYMDIIKSEFNKIGYDIYYKVYMCSKLDIGVPQNRERLIIVGIRQDLNQDFEFPEQNENKSGNLKDIVRFTMEGTLKLKPEYLDFNFDDIPEECILSDMDNDEDENNPHPNLINYATKRDYERQGVKRPHRLHFGRRLDVGGEIIDIRKPINTIICSYAHCPRFFIPQKNKNGNYLRCLTPDELKQCQGFPSDYKISGNTGKKVKQIGNAVPPPLIELIIKNLKF